MRGEHEMEVIAHIRTDFPEKFGIPRQSGLVDALEGSVVFTEPYRDASALRGLEGYSHLWLLWRFRGNQAWSPTVKPPRLGGNKRVGVFATRSPHRPNPIGLSCVRLSGIDWRTPEGPVLRVRGADLMDGTPIYDIKPYLPYADAIPDATGGFAADIAPDALRVTFPEALLQRVPAEKREALEQVLALDPRPRYQADGREYGLSFAGWNVRFVVNDGELTVIDVEEDTRESGSRREV